MKTTKRLLALNLVLVLLLTLMPMAALADVVSMKLGETVTFTKVADSDNVAEFTFTPKKAGAYRIEITRPYPNMASPTFLMNFGTGKTNRTLDVYSNSDFQSYTDDNGQSHRKWNMNIAYDLKAGVKYSFKFEENANGAYEAKISYIGKTEEIVQINQKNFPDENFRNIVSGKYDFDEDGWLSTAEILNAETVDVGYSNIESLEGIEYFTAMTTLRCYGNQLTTLPKLPESLKELNCNDNQLGSLDNLPKALETLYCGSNKFTNLPDNLLGSLKFLSCRGTRFDSQPNFPDSLESLDCADCGLKELSKLPKNLKSLNCGYNELTSLPELPASLTMLYCGGNKLTNIKLNNNKDYYRIDVSNNNLAGYDSVTGFKVIWDENSFTFGEQNHVHDMENGYKTIVSPTCTNDGYTRTRCAKCAYYEDSDHTSAFGGRHVLQRYENELFEDILICTRCNDTFNFYVEEENCEAPGEENELKYTYTRVYADGGSYDTVVISGKGAMVDYDMVAAPWSGNVRSFIVEEGVTSLGYGAAMSFYGSSQSLAEVQLPSTLKTIGKRAFAYNIGLESITLPDGLETIGEEAFEGCNLLEAVSIPASVTKIGEKSFSPDGSTIYNDNEVFAFSAYEVAEENKNYKSDEGILYSKDGKILINCPAGKTDMNIKVANGTTTLSDWAFYGNCNVQSITLPNTITTEISSAGFEHCNNLKTIYFMGTIEQWNEVGIYLEGINVICLGQETAGDSLMSAIAIDRNERVVITAYDEGIISNDNNYAYFAEANLTGDQLGNFVVIGADQYQAYDIKLMTSDNEKVDLNGLPVQVKLTAPEGYDINRCKVYHVVDGNLILMNTIVETDDNGTAYLVFATDSFSPFIVVHEHAHQCGEVKTVAPTCTAQGYTEKACTVDGCNYTVKENFVNATGHTVVIDQATKPTCDVDGLTEGKHCSECNDVIVPQALVRRNGHNFGDDYRCTVCGKECTHSDAEIVVDIAQPATCTETGLTEGQHCGVCGKVILKQEVIPANGHTYKNGKCSVCGAKDPTYTPPTPTHTHKYVTEVTEPTCTEMGFTTFTCACGKSSYIGNYVDALGHDYKDGVCTRCGAEDPDYVANPFNDVKEGDDFYNEILWAANEKLVNGYTDGSFKAGNTINRAEVVTMLWRQAGSPEAKAAASFADVAADAWYAKAVAWAVEKGITEGTSATTFEPEKACTRGEIVTFLWRANDKPTATAAADFTDLTENWYKDAVAWAAEVGVTKGEGNGIFNPDGSCTRGQVAAFMFRLAQLSK